MSNDELYASGLLIRALAPETQPPPIQVFMQAEIEFLDAFVGARTTWLDVGCGTGRHLALLHGRLRLGVGVDYEQAYVADARRRAGAPLLHFIVADAAHLPFRARFNLSTCLTNTWGTMSDKPGVLVEMRRCAEVRLLSVFSERSMTARREWYQRFGHPIVKETPEWLLTAGGLRSEHFTEARLRALVGDCTIMRCTDIGYIVRF